MKIMAKLFINEINSELWLWLHGIEWSVYHWYVCMATWGWLDTERIIPLMKWRYQQQGCRWASHQTSHWRQPSQSLKLNPLSDCHLWLLLTLQHFPAALLSHLKTEFGWKRALAPHDLSVLDRSVKHWYDALRKRKSYDAPHPVIWKLMDGALNTGL